MPPSGERKGGWKWRHGVSIGAGDQPTEREEPGGRQRKGTFDSATVQKGSDFYYKREGGGGGTDRGGVVDRRLTELETPLLSLKEEIEKTSHAWALILDRPRKENEERTLYKGTRALRGEIQGGEFNSSRRIQNREKKGSFKVSR